MSADPSNQGPFLGVDLGLARTGVAACDEGLKLAFPVETLRGSAGRIEGELIRICRDRGIRGVVLGLPLHMDGREGDLAPKVRRLARRIFSRLEVPVWLWDERLTTVEVERRMREAGAGGRPRDDLAATLILQAFLDAEAWRGSPLVGGEEGGGANGS